MTSRIAEGINDALHIFSRDLIYDLTPFTIELYKESNQFSAYNRIKKQITNSDSGHLIQCSFGNIKYNPEKQEIISIQFTEIPPDLCHGDTFTVNSGQKTPVVKNPCKVSDFVENLVQIISNDFPNYPHPNERLSKRLLDTAERFDESLETVLENINARSAARILADCETICFPLLKKRIFNTPFPPDKLPRLADSYTSRHLQNQQYYLVSDDSEKPSYLIEEPYLERKSGIPLIIYPVDVSYVEGTTPKFILGYDYSIKKQEGYRLEEIGKLNHVFTVRKTKGYKSQHSAIEDYLKLQELSNKLRETNNGTALWYLYNNGIIYPSSSSEVQIETHSDMDELNDEREDIINKKLFHGNYSNIEDKLNMIFKSSFERINIDSIQNISGEPIEITMLGETMIIDNALVSPFKRKNEPVSLIVPEPTNVIHRRSGRGVWPTKMERGAYVIDSLNISIEQS